MDHKYQTMTGVQGPLDLGPYFCTNASSVPQDSFIRLTAMTPALGILALRPTAQILAANWTPCSRPWHQGSQLELTLST